MLLVGAGHDASDQRAGAELPQHHSHDIIPPRRASEARACTTACRTSCERSWRCRRFCRRRRGSGSSSMRSKCDRSPTTMKTCGSRCSEISPTPKQRRCRSDREIVDLGDRADRGAEHAIRVASVSTCFIAGASGTHRKAGGWAGSGSAASCTSSTACCEARRTRASTVRSAISTAAERALRHHARFGYGSAARRRPKARRHAGASAEPRAIRRPRPAA